ncbi:glucosamine-6-phosphate deaminase [Radiobacillus kanasensis]|uniref:glucosamine-6-phosphate deaminase n=1 Tax=Radiobacillus kanasensis TaxID=2844358 RepID=UPI001E4A40C7|nr:glucosamine-6-phosphate deaminase [Radiobacillus kanasensis]UFT99868.1 glucosamine-6-phosphate deaminase [Radiobacillus kanasensis]
MNVVEVDSYNEMSRKASELIVKKIKENTSSVLGLATGGTVIRVYQMLIKDHLVNGTSYREVNTINLDEYVGLGSSDSNSYRYYMNENLFTHLDIPQEQSHLPNGMATNRKEECVKYEELIGELGGVDLQLLGIGENGHIGFNEPGTSFRSKTHVVKLMESTRKANARYFSSLDSVPTHAVTMGIDTIFRSKQILLLASGMKKAAAIDWLLNGEVSEDLPASILKKHNRVTVIADKDALSLSKVSGITFTK